MDSLLTYGPQRPTPGATPSAKSLSHSSTKSLAGCGQIRRCKQREAYKKNRRSRCRKRMTYWENRPGDGDKEWPAGKTDQQMESKNGLLEKD
ncbi:hypothetical protein PoB_001330200 [Plakobranchus ocellatus]|uniref:Uncharacterized protein n=1 Tax=Plakobranchus ocellatus TaxID=259542 RepID=A0AAV3YX99_9GAST|nr:hypothetical protein PoB_001330200 [Plakobranchus ocellatus]